MIKLLFKLVFAVILLLVIGVVVLYFSFDSIVKKTVEVEGTNQLKVATTLGGVSLGLVKGTVDLTDFTLGSPAGFTAPRMMSIGELRVDSGGISNLRGKPVHINTIDLENPFLVVEEVNNKLNFKAMMENLPSSPDQKAKPAAQSDQTKLVIDSLTVNGASVQLDVSVAMIKKHFDVKLPAFTMKNIGNADGKNQGADIKDVVTAVLTQMVNNAAKDAGVPVDVQGLLSGNLDSVKDKLTDAAKQQLGALNLPPAAGNLIDGLTGKTDANGQKQDPLKSGEDLGKGLLKNLGH